MAAIKLTKIGNSQGFTIPKDMIEKSSFELGESLEVHLHNGRFIIFKKPPHHSEMIFKGKQEQEEIDWADAYLGEWD